LRATPKAAILKPLRHTITIQIVAQFSSSLSRYSLHGPHCLPQPFHLAQQQITTSLNHNDGEKDGASRHRRSQLMRHRVSLSQQG
jgi:hypothetical protein